MPVPDYTAVTREQARAAIRRHTPATYAAARAFYDGDHWQRTAGWIGTQPYENGEESAEVWRLIEAGFISANKIAEIVDRHAAGVVGREPAWSLTPRRALADDEQPTPDEQARIDAAEALLTEWWDRAQAPEALRAAVAYALTGARGVLRAYVPEAHLTPDADGVLRLSVPPGDLAAALARLELEALPPDRAAVLRDRATGQDVGVVSIPAATGPFETAAADDGPAELHYRADDGQTVVAVVGAGERAEAALPLGGRLLVAQIARPPLVTPQLLRLQMSLNHSLTMLQKNSDLAGSVERWITGASRPGRFYRDAEGAWQFEAEPVQVGAGTTTFLAGVPIYHPEARNADGSPVVVGYTSPSVQRIDPVPVDTFVGTQDQLYAMMLSEAQQRHALISGDAAASGESRIQARADFEASLAPTARAVEGALRSLLEAVLAAAAHFAGRPALFADLRAEVACQIDTGPLSAAEVQSLISLTEAGLRSEETAMAESGVADVAAERARISAERAERAARAPQIAPIPAAAPQGGGAPMPGPAPNGRAPRDTPVTG